MGLFETLRRPGREVLPQPPPAGLHTCAPSLTVHSSPSARIKARAAMAAGVPDSDLPLGRFCLSGLDKILADSSNEFGWAGDDDEELDDLAVDA